MARNEFETRLQDMRRAEYGSRGEIVIRYTVMATVVLALTFILDPGLALAWAAGYALFEGGLASSLVLEWKGSAQVRYFVVLGFYVLANACFMSLPLYLIAADISTSLTFTGAAGLMGLLLYTLARTQREIGLVIADSVQMLVMSAILLVVLQPRLTGWIDRVTVLIIALAVAGYYIGSLIAGWRLQQELKEAQLRYAAAQKARALGQFVAGVAHDFNNQLTAILGHLELIERLDNPAERAEAIQAIRAAARHAAATVQQLLATSGRIRLAPGDVAMQTFLYDLGDLLSDLLDPGMSVEILPPNEPLTAHVDRDMLETCALQLCLNAQDATRGKGRICLSVERRLSPPGIAPPPEAPPPHVALIVEDDGPGVPPDTLPLLAEPFYSTKPASEGRGLGLSAVAGFARQSGGALVLEPALQGGLRAIVLLPETEAPGASVRASQAVQAG